MPIPKEMMHVPVYVDIPLNHAQELKVNQAMV